MKRKALPRCSTTLASLPSDPYWRLRLPQLETNVLKIHLDSGQLAWFTVPALLLLLLLSLAFFLAIHDFSTAVDLTDPLDTALIALNSPSSPTVKAFATGRESARIRLGELNEGPHRPVSIVFRAGKGENGLGGLERPKRASFQVQNGL
jgi:hypothetical protein